MDQLAEHVGGAGADIGAAEVEADDEAGAVAHHVGDRAAPAAAVLGADGRDIPACSRRPTAAPTVGLDKAGGGGDLRTGDRAPAEDRLQHGLLAELAQQAQARIGRPRRCRRR